MTKDNRAAFFVGMFVCILIMLLGSFTIANGKDFSKKLKFASGTPPTSFFGKYQKWWADEVEKRTNGRLKFEFYWMEALVKWKDMLHGLQFGMTDVGLPVSTYHPSELPLLMMLDNPYNVEDYWACMMAVLDTQDNEPGLKAELKKQDIYFLAPYVSGYDFIHTEKPFNSIDEIKGKTLRTYGGAKIKMLKYVGLNPVFMSYSEIYEAMDRGTIFGNADASIQLSDAFKHQEVGKFAYLTNYSCAIGTGIGINRTLFDTFPKDIQEILRKLQKDSADHYAYEIFKVEDEIKKKWKKDFGVIIRDVSPEDDRLLREAGIKTTDAFLDEQEAKGHPARKTWNYYLKSQQKYIEEVKSKGYPWERK